MGHAFKTSSFFKINLPHNIRTVSLPSFLQTLWLWHARARSRRHLARPNEDLLLDIGVDRASAEAEAAKGEAEAIKVEAEAARADAEAAKAQAETALATSAFV